MLDVRPPHLSICGLWLMGRLCRICLDKLGVFQESDRAALVTKVFWR